LKPDPEIDLPIELRVERFKAGRPRTGQYAERTVEELREDITRVTDLSLAVIKERDKLQAEKQSAEIVAEARQLWIKILASAASVELIVIGFFAAQFFARLK
jgi:hypothetical protein